MEALRSVGGRIQRKPLADCTNVVVSRASQQPSSSIKYPNPSLSSSLKRKLDQTTVKDVNTSEASYGSASWSLFRNFRLVSRRISADLGSPASSPSRPKTSRSDLGVSDKEIAGPLSRLRQDLTSSSWRKTQNNNKMKPLKVAPRKRQRTVRQERESSVDAATQEYIEKQNAYFAEIDAFELPEEDVSGSDLD